MKAMKKRGVCMILAGVMLVAGTSKTSKATAWEGRNENTKNGSEVSPCAAYATKCNVKLLISGGKTQIHASVSGHMDVSKIHAKIVLQNYSDNSWKAIKYMGDSNWRLVPDSDSMESVVETVTLSPNCYKEEAAKLLREISILPVYEEVNPSPEVGMRVQYDNWGEREGIYVLRDGEYKEVEMQMLFYDLKEKKLEQKGTVPYTSASPLTLYSTIDDAIYYSAFSGKMKGNQIYSDHNGIVEKKTDQFCDFNHLIQCGKQYFMAAELLQNYCMEPIVCDAEFQNCSRVMYDKKDDRFTWVTSAIPKENRIVFSHYSDNAMRETGVGEAAPSKIAMLDLETKKTETVYETEYYVTGIACEGKKLILACAPDNRDVEQGLFRKAQKSPQVAV